jgi:hypothetical protein
MNINTYDTYQAEIAYRSNRLRKDVGRNGRRARRPFVRRQSEASNTSL